MLQVGYLLELYRDARSPEYKIRFSIPFREPQVLSCLNLGTENHCLHRVKSPYRTAKGIYRHVCNKIRSSIKPYFSNYFACEKSKLLNLKSIEGGKALKTLHRRCYHFMSYMNHKAYLLPEIEGTHTRTHAHAHTQQKAPFPFPAPATILLPSQVFTSPTTTV